MWDSPFGQAWSQFYVRYYIVALIFVVFDVETVFLFPWAVVYKHLAKATARARSSRPRRTR